MVTNQSDHSLGEGVYYANADYAGLFRRVLALVADAGVIILAGVMMEAARSYLAPPDSPYHLLKATWMAWLGFSYLYLVVIKPSRLRSLGYWLTGTRVVTLRGQRPSIVRMTFRLLLWLFGPFNLVYDLLWMGIDDDRQSLRDAFSGTYVVKADARPVGQGQVHLIRYFALGFALMYPKVVRKPTG